MSFASYTSDITCTLPKLTHVQRGLAAIADLGVILYLNETTNVRENKQKIYRNRHYAHKFIKGCSIITENLHMCTLSLCILNMVVQAYEVKAHYCAL